MWEVEYTDTCGGQANYSWVERATVPDGSRLAVMRRAKAAVGLSGVRGRTYWHGDGGEFRPFGSSTVMFVTWSDAPAFESTPLEDFVF